MTNTPEVNTTLDLHAESNSNTAPELSCVGASIAAKEQAVCKFFYKVFRQFNARTSILSFNGGKDCTVILHMLSKYFKCTRKLRNKPIQVLYIQGNDTFEEIEEFVQECNTNYNIELIQRQGSIKTALEQVCAERPELQAVFMGSRRTDPYCENLTLLQKTDEGWPELMRVNPILDWTCKDVWQYIFSNKVPYCKLYDLGYTSLGNKKNTKPNPHLQRVDEDTGEVSYRPAYELDDDDSLERAGRE